MFLTEALISLLKILIQAMFGSWKFKRKKNSN